MTFDNKCYPKWQFLSNRCSLIFEQQVQKLSWGRNYKQSNFTGDFLFGRKCRNNCTVQLFYPLSSNSSPSMTQCFILKDMYIEWQFLFSPLHKLEYRSAYLLFWSAFNKWKWIWKWIFIPVLLIITHRSKFIINYVTGHLGDSSIRGPKGCDAAFTQFS